MDSEKSKYQRWYEELIDSARKYPITTVYSEVHHILPRSCGGGDEPENLVRLDYRRHFLAHWLLIKFYRGIKLRKMQRAMIAMTLPLHGDRIIASWQFDVAKRAVKDLAMTPTQIRNRIIAKRSAVIAQEYARGQAIADATGGKDLKALTEEFLGKRRTEWRMGMKQLPPLSVSLKDGEEKRRRHRRRRPRPGKRARMAKRSEFEAFASQFRIT